MTSTPSLDLVAGAIRPGPLRDRVARARREAGPAPWLVGYDANAIQELITACGRPVSMRGASATIARFDARQGRKPRTIFAGGGRGILLARDRAEARALAAHLAEDFQRRTFGGVMAAASVPLDPARVRDSLRWLRSMLDIAKDAARAPGGRLPCDRESECVDCRRHPAWHPRRRDGRVERVCSRCHAMRRVGQRTGEMSQSLVTFSEHGRIAAVSADGNDLGAFFESLESLEELAAASEAVRVIFHHAHARALDAVAGEKIPLMTGGDDVRAFLPPSGLLAYVHTLARAVEEAAACVGDAGGLLGPERAAALARLGVGIGAVVADDHFPAWRLMAQAHDCETQAKRVCRPGGEVPGARAGTRPAASAAPRSALGLAVITTEHAVAGEGAAHGGGGHVFSLAEDAWPRTLCRARALGAVPRAQLAILAEARALGEAERANLFRYQVARSSHWQRWYEQWGGNWRDPDQVIETRPEPGLLALLSLVSAEAST